MIKYKKKASQWPKWSRNERANLWNNGITGDTQVEVRKLSQTDNITHYAYKNNFAQNLGDRDKMMLVEQEL